MVIDALDESGPEPSQSHILSVLGSPRVAKLLSSFCLLMTPQSLPDIQAVLNIAPHVKAVSLDDVPTAFTECDICLFIFVQLKGLEDIRQDTTGELVKECFSNATVHVSREGKSLVDNMYHTTLESVVSKRPTALVCFCSVMRQVLYTLEPLPINGLDAMC